MGKEKDVHVKSNMINIHTKERLINEIKNKFNDRNLAIAIISTLKTDDKYELMLDFMKCEMDYDRSDVLIVAVIIKNNTFKNIGELQAALNEYK